MLHLQLDLCRLMKLEVGAQLSPEYMKYTTHTFNTGVYTKMKSIFRTS